MHSKNFEPASPNHKHRLNRNCPTRNTTSHFTIVKSVQAEPGHEADTSQQQEEEECQVREMSMSLSDNEDEEEEEREVCEMSIEVSEDENEQEDEQPLALSARIPSLPQESSHPPAPAPGAEVQAQFQIPTQQEPATEHSPEHLDGQPPQPRQETPHFLLDEDSPMPLHESHARFDVTPEVGDESKDTDADPGLVKIISSDPRAAAHAAAILKQDESFVYTKDDDGTLHLVSSSSLKPSKSPMVNNKRLEWGDFMITYGRMLDAMGEAGWPDQ
ncbi:hypothetical protein BJ165DRAFT_1531880 [Panaeolus papilionaceus]|nr:hypothetical protein BJ165DRAFT_1531880 [Panaeolus papilionaceus]